MIVSVSTVRDTPERLRRFVDRNAGRGIDHLVLFVDTDQPEVLEALADDVRVTLVATASGWWHGDERPPGLNRRQNTNASAVNAVLATLGWADWLFHVDADEVVHLDRDRLEGLGGSVGVVHLQALEAVSVADGGSEREFKRPASEDELALLHRLGLIATPEARSLFRGHTGKSGLRPTLDVGVGTHWPIDGGKRLDEGALTADWLQLLHLESVTFAEFSRKWRNLVSSGPARGASMTRDRAELATAVRTLLGRGVAADVEERYLRALYDRFVADPRDGLADLGMLVDVDPDEPRFPARPVPHADVAALRAGLAAVAEIDKVALRAGSRADREALLGSVGLL